MVSLYVANNDFWAFRLAFPSYWVAIFNLHEWCITNHRRAPVIGASAWRLYTAEKYKKEIESGLREYRGEKAELTAELATRD